MSKAFPVARLRWRPRDLLRTLFIFIRKKPVGWCAERPGEVLLYYRNGHDIFSITGLLQPWDFADDDVKFPK